MGSATGIATKTRQFLHWFFMGIDDKHHHCCHDQVFGEDRTSEEWQALVNADPVVVIVQRAAVNCGVIAFHDPESDNLNAIRMTVEGYGEGSSEPMSVTVVMAEVLAWQLHDAIPLTIAHHHLDCLGGL